MWWGGYSLGPRHLIPVLPFFSLLMIFVPERFKVPWIILCMISCGQMLVAAASNMLVPDDMVANIASSGFFAYSNIYSYCLQQLLSGKFIQISQAMVQPGLLDESDSLFIIMADV
jgi:hypothetical protein